MPATRLVIEELTGARRRIELAGRAGPTNNGGASWGVEIRSKKTGYPGNPRSSIQPLGPDWLDTPLMGHWIDRYLVDGQSVVQATGFPALGQSPWRSTDLVFAFYSLAVSSNALRVSWFNEVREGILKRFVPRYGVPTGVDVEWELEFEWSGRDFDPTLRAAPAQPEPAAEMRTEMNSTDASASRRPLVAITDTGLAVQVAQFATRMIAAACFDAFRALARGVATGQPPSTLAAPVAAVVTSTGTLVTVMETEWNAVVDVPRTSITQSDQLGDLIAIEAWRRDLAYQQELLRDGSLNRARLAAQRVVPGQLTLVAVAAGASLRQIALQFFGDSDGWMRIADVNGLSGTIVPSAQTLVIPPTSS